LMAILHGLWFHWTAIVLTWLLGMDTRLRLGRERFERVMLPTKLLARLGLRRHFLALSKHSKVCF
jgi:hypothetical protein